MIRKSSSFLVLVIVVFTLWSCSGLPNRSGSVVVGGGGNNGITSLTLTLFDAPPAGVSVVYLSVPIELLSLTPATGTDVNLPVISNPSDGARFFELTRLQTDSSIIKTFQGIPTGTYTKLNIFSTESSFGGVFFNGSGGALLGCGANSLCNFSSSAQGQISIDLTKVSGLSSQGLVVGQGQQISLGIEINLAQALTPTTTGSLGVNLQQTGAVTVVVLPRAGQPAGTVDTVQDFLGTVAAVSSGKITLLTGLGKALVGTAGTGTKFDGPSGGSSACGGTFNLACVAVGQTLSVDGEVAADGSVTLTNVDFLDISNQDDLQGTILSTGTPGTFKLVVNEHIQPTANFAADPILPGEIIPLTLDPATTFAVDTSNLGISSPAGFSAAADIQNGQNVLVHVKSVTTTPSLSAVADRLVLRFSRLTGTVGTISGNVFTMQNFQSFFGTPVTPPGVQTFVPQTTFDNVTGGSIAGLTSGDSVSIRALFLNPSKVPQPFLAAGVRKH